MSQKIFEPLSSLLKSSPICLKNTEVSSFSVPGFACELIPKVVVGAVASGREEKDLVESNDEKEDDDENCVEDEIPNFLPAAPGFRTVASPPVAQVGFDAAPPKNPRFLPG